MKGRLTFSLWFAKYLEEAAVVTFSLCVWGLVAVQACHAGQAALGGATSLQLLSCTPGLWDGEILENLP